MDKAERLLEIAVTQKVTVSVAESCTGGLLGGRITGVSGSSDYFLGGVIAYSDRAKNKLLGVSMKTLETFGAVSERCASEMAIGARRLLGSELAIAITGIAGPLGGTPGKPVGTVYIATALGSEAAIKRFQFSGDRESIRAQSVEAALDMAIEAIEGG